VIGMGKSKGGKSSKNNPDNKVKRKEPKIISSTECLKCNEKCDAYFKYEKSLSEGKIGKGVCCRKGL
jgi:hypothetical protein